MGIEQRLREGASAGQRRCNLGVGQCADVNSDEALAKIAVVL